MIFLIVTIPFYVADVMALPEDNYNYPGHQITKVWLYGNDEINGALRESSETIKVRVEINVADVLPHQVLFNNVEQFNNCSTQFGLSYCTYEAPHPSVIGVQPFSVRYSSDIVTGNYYIDNTAPAVNNIAATPDSVGVGNVTLSYQAHDYYLSTDFSGCSGISELQIIEEGTLRETINVNTTDCVVTDTMAYDPVGITGERRNSTICMKAIDNFGQESEDSCIEVLVDNALPQISAPYIIQNNVKVDFLQSGLQTFDIAVNDTYGDINLITMSSISLDKVNETASCINGVCKWSSIIYNVDNATTAFDAQFYINDVYGNSDVVTTTIPVVKDDLAPVIESVASTYTAEGVNYFGIKDNTVIATITEGGSGLNPLNVKADFAPVGGRLETADNCTVSGSINYCGWYDIDTTIEGTFGVTFTAVDNVGNVAVSKTESIVVDRTPPSTDSYFIGADGAPSAPEDNESLTNAKGLQLSITSQAGYEFYQVGDDLEISFILSDTESGISDVDSSVNLSGITLEGVAYPTCTLISEEVYGVYDCVFTARQILGPKIGAKLRFNICDNAGNCIPYIEEIDIRESEAGVADFWRIVVEGNMPNEIDRQTTALVQQRMYFNLALRSKSSGSIEPIFMEITDCGPQAAQAFLADTPSLLGYTRGSTEAWMKLTLAQQSIEVDNLTFECRASIVTKHGQKISQPEIEVFNVTVPLYNMPLGEISDNVQEKIDEVQNGWLVQGEWIGSFNNLMQRMKQTCALISTLSTAVTAYNSFALAFGWTRFTGILLPIQKAIEGTSDALTFAFTGIVKLVQYTCVVGSCQIIPKIVEQLGLKNTNELVQKIILTLIAPNSKGSALTAIPGMGQINQQDSLWLSVFTLCLPGIIYNLQKARNIECKYIQCLRDEVPQGKPVFICDSMRGYEWCTYVTHPFLELIPFKALASQLYHLVEDLFKNPLSLGLGLAALACWAIPNFETKKGCHITAGVQATISVAYYIYNFKDQWELDADYCELVLNETEEEDEEEEEE